MNVEYFKTSINGQFGYVRFDCLEKLRVVNAIIFDCDGVLIDVRESYKKTIVKTVEFFIDALTGIKLPSDDIFDKPIYLYKRSGGFNNDWDIVYSILLSILSMSPKIFQEKFIGLINAKEFECGTLYERFRYVKASLEELKPMNFIKDWSKLIITLNKLVEQADKSGIKSIDAYSLLNSASSSQIFYEATKRFFNYPESVGESLLTTVFDEIFYGSKLFEEKHRFSPAFYLGKGLVEAENKIITLETLDELAEVIGETNFGIVSGRDYMSAKYTLNRVLDKYEEKALFFLQDFEMDIFKKVNKPSPILLLKSAEGLNPFKYAIYIGDSVEDILMVNNANEINPRFISMGVYSTSDFKEDFILHLIEMKTDIILHSINDLAILLRDLMEEKK